MECAYCNADAAVNLICPDCGEPSVSLCQSCANNDIRSNPDMWACENNKCGNCYLYDDDDDWD